MKVEEMSSVSTSQKKENVSQEQIHESLLSTDPNPNTTLPDEKHEVEFVGSEKNSARTFTSLSVLSLQTMKVYLRLKPFPSNIDLTSEQECAYAIVNSTTLLTKLPGIDKTTRSLKILKTSESVCRTFTFTNTFGPDTSQIDLFNKAIVHQIQDFLAGQSSTVMSYGTSNAGKSYTLYGEPVALGIIPLSINFIFRNVNSTLTTSWFKPVYQNNVISLSSKERLRELEIRDKLLSSFESTENIEFLNAYRRMREDEPQDSISGEKMGDVIYSVWISFAEIYNDAIYDLLSSDCHKKRVPLKMVTDKQGKIFIKDLKIVYVNSEEEAYQVLLAGQYRSRIAATTLNSRSSRSHCIFTIKLLKYYAESTPDEVEVSSLSFCDLAGSGRLKTTANIGDRLKETQNINTSLLVLGRCLKSIWEGQTIRHKSQPVGPFRESKLTRLFQKALSGKEQMTLIVNVNPVPNFYAETQNVLNSSAIAKKIFVEPVKDVKKKKFTSRFSRVVSRSVETVTDWDHAAVEDVSHEIDHDKLRNSDYVLRECYDDLFAEYEKLLEDHATLKGSVMQKDLEIREEMANTYTGLINDLETSWRSRSKDAEEQQEHLLAWSVNQVENFYKEKLNRLNSRKRRRWDDGDAVDDREADIRKMEDENSNLTARIVVAKETIKELRSARENAIAEKNKAIFELSLVKEEMIGIKKMLEAAENDIRSKEDGAHFIEELKRQLTSREERIKNLKEFLNEAKEEYIRITSDAGQMEQQLKDTNATLIENAETIEDLEEQLDQSSICLAEQAKGIEQLTEKLERQSKQLVEFEKRAQTAEEKLKESEFIRLNLMGAVEDLNKLHEIRCTHACHDSNDYYRHHENMSKIKSPKSNAAPEITNVESENSPIKCESTFENRYENIDSKNTDLQRLNSSSVGTQDATNIFENEGSVIKIDHTSIKTNDSSEINDSGIALTVTSQNQSSDHDEDSLNRGAEHEKKIFFASSEDTQMVYLESENGKLTARNLFESISLQQLSTDSENAKSEIAEVTADDMGGDSKVRTTKYDRNLKSIETEPRSVDVNNFERELQFAEIIMQLEAKVDEYDAKFDTLHGASKIRRDEERFYFESLNDRVASLEKQLTDAFLFTETAAMKCLIEHEMEIKKLEEEVCELKGRSDESQYAKTNVDSTLKMQIELLNELKLKVTEFEQTLTKWQEEENIQHRQLNENVRKLSVSESQIKNWPTQERRNTNVISSLNDELRTEIKTTAHDKSESLIALESNDQSMEKLENLLRDLHNEEQIEDHSGFSAPVIARLESIRSISDVTSPSTIDLLAASTPTLQEGGKNSDNKSTQLGTPSQDFMSSSNSPIPTKKFIMTKKKLFANPGGGCASLEPVREVHSILRPHEILLIIFVAIVYAIGKV